MSDRLAELCEIAGPVSRETAERLDTFETAFVKWSARINLAAPSTLPELWHRHILDSAQLLPLAPTAQRWLDIGSGGGFPGAVVAILLRERPGTAVELVESNNKKAAFLRSVLAEVGAPATVHAIRIEEASTRVAMPDIVTARALAGLGKLLGLSAPWLTRGATGLFHKGRDYAAEITETHDAWRFDLVEHRSRIEPTSRILEISRLERS